METFPINPTPAAVQQSGWKYLVFKAHIIFDVDDLQLEEEKLLGT